MPRCRVCGGPLPNKWRTKFCGMDCSEKHRKEYRASWYQRVKDGEHQPQRRQGRKLTADDGLDEVRLELFGYALALHGCVRPSPGTVKALKPEAKQDMLDMVCADDRMRAGGWKRG